MAQNRCSCIVKNLSTLPQRIDVWKVTGATVLFCLMLSSTVITRAATGPAVAPQSEANRLELSYTLDLERPSTHLLQVEITAKQVSVPIRPFTITAWAACAYGICDWANAVQELLGFGAGGKVL